MRYKENDSRFWLFYTPIGRLILLILFIVVVGSVILKMLGIIN